MEIWRHNAPVGTRTTRHGSIKFSTNPVAYAALLAAAVTVMCAQAAFADHTTVYVSNTPGSYILPWESESNCLDAGNCFDPSMVTVDVGGVVVWTNDDYAAHTVTSGDLATGGPDGAFDSGLYSPGGEFSHEFGVAGEYPYYCVIHPYMAGVVVVLEPDAYKEAVGDETVSVETPPNAELEDPVEPVPEQPFSVTAIFDSTVDFAALGGAADLEVFGAGNHTYLAVAAPNDDGVQIIDITDPASPAPVSATHDGVGGFDALGGAADLEVFGAGDRLYVVVAAPNDDGVQIIDITDPASPAPVSATHDGVGGFDALGGAADLEVFGAGDRLYVVVAAPNDDGVQIIDITDPARPAPVAAMHDGMGRFDALGGAADLEVFGAGDRLYVVVAAPNDDGVQIIDITDPARPAPVSAIYDGSGGFVLAGTQDLEAFGMGGQTYMAVTSGWNDGVQIIDVTDPASPAPVSAAFYGAGGFGALAGAAGIELLESVGRTYMAVTSPTYGGVQMIDITDPARMIPVSAAFDGSRGFGALAGAYDLESFSSGDSLYVAVASSQDSGVQIIDVTDQSHMAPVSAAFDDSKDFSALAGPQDLDVFYAEGSPYVAVAARGDDGIQIMDVTDPARPAPVSAIYDGTGGFDTLAGVYDLDVFGMEDRTYVAVAAPGDDGVQIIDMTDIARPAPVSAASDGSGGYAALDGTIGVATFSSGDRTYLAVAAFVDDGVQIIDVTDPARMAPVSAAFDSSGGYVALNGAHDLEAFSVGDRTYLAVAARLSDGVQIIDVTDPARMAPVSAAFDGSGGYAALDDARDLEVFAIGDRTYLAVAAYEDDGVQIIDVTDPARMAPVSAVYDGADGFEALDGAVAVGIFASGDRTYLAVAAFVDNGIQIMDVTDPARPAPVSAFLDGSGGFGALGGANGVGVFASGDRSYLAVASKTEDGIQIIDLALPAPAGSGAKTAGNGADGGDPPSESGPSEPAGMADPSGGDPPSESGPSEPAGMADPSGGDPPSESGPSEPAGMADPSGGDPPSESGPSEPAPVSAAFDGSGGFDTLGGASSLEMFSDGSRAYLAVAAHADNGVQIIDITDPATPAPFSAMHDGSGGFDALGGATDLEVFNAGSRPYMAVAAQNDDGVQIIDITDPARPAPVSAIYDGSGGFDALGGAADLEVFGARDSLYVAVAAQNDDGVQIIDITDPARPAPVSVIYDGSGGFDALGGATDLEVFNAGSRPYMAVAAQNDDGVQIIDITDPVRPAPVAAVFAGSGLALDAAYDLEAFRAEGRTYMAVVSQWNDGVQIMDVTDPASPAPVSAMHDGSGGFVALGGAADLEVFDAGSRLYVAVAAYLDDGIQIIDVADPASPAPVSAIHDGSGGFVALGGAADLEVFDAGDSLYVAVAAQSDGGVQIVAIAPPS